MLFWFPRHKFIITQPLQSNISLSEVLISEWLNTASPPERFLQQPLIGPNKLLPLLLEHVRAELLVKGPFVSSLPRVFRIAFDLKGYYSQIHNLEY